jgi:hypothetical protein
VALIKKRLGMSAVVTHGARGQFEVIADGQTIAARRGNWLTRSFGAGYPNLNGIVDELEQRRDGEPPRGDRSDPQP